MTWMNDGEGPPQLTAEEAYDAARFAFSPVPIRITISSSGRFLIFNNLRKCVAVVEPNDTNRLKHLMNLAKRYYWMQKEESFRPHFRSERKRKPIVDVEL